MRANWISPQHASVSLPLYVATVERLPSVLATLPEAQQRQAAARQFKGEGSTATWLMSPDGSLGGVLVGVSDLHDPFAYSHVVPMLPAGSVWHVANADALEPAMRDALALGWALGGYKYLKYKPKLEHNPAKLAMDVSDEVSRAYDAIVTVRHLIHTPSQDMGPEQLHDVVANLAEMHGANFRAIVGDELLEQNFPAIHAVGRASHRAPRLLELNWSAPDAKQHIVIVGKGVCFDTGGLDIKPADGMRNMKKDMGGAAHAIGLAQWILQAQLPVRLTLLIGAVENAIGPDAYRPGEVINTRKGFTVEIDNTDAEGRVVLCDALAYACEKQPDLVMDFATLTGAARIALGPDLPALFANNDALAQSWLDAGLELRDPVWRMPLHTPYWRYLSSGIADFANAGPSKMAGAVTAAIYLQRFMDPSIPWTHLDVYSWNDADRPGRPAGGEAQALRSAYALVRSIVDSGH
ncbi:leucyl aminopeptidase family protein [Luteimonas sp. FXH3W]|uniref:Leucyl aminopeptidase family protein n=1 Tax=Aquilutibacter rugosus TaxID=3115820 RepID=A0ABU7UZ43_9GAMM